MADRQRKKPPHVAFYPKLNTSRKWCDPEHNENLTQGKLHREKKHTGDAKKIAIGIPLIDFCINSWVYAVINNKNSWNQ